MAASGEFHFSPSTSHFQLHKKKRVIASAARKNLLKGGRLLCLQDPGNGRQMGNTKLGRKCAFNTIVIFSGHDIFSCLQLTLPQVPFYWAVPEA